MGDTEDQRFVTLHQQLGGIGTGKLAVEVICDTGLLGHRHASAEVRPLVRVVMLEDVISRGKSTVARRMVAICLGELTAAHAFFRLTARLEWPGVSNRETCVLKQPTYTKRNRHEQVSQHEIVLVTGDVVVYHNLYRGSRKSPAETKGMGSVLSQTSGGSRLIYELLAAITQQCSAEADRLSVEFGLDEASLTQLAPHLHGYGLWESCPSADDGKKKVWRQTQSLGYGAPDANPISVLPNFDSLEQSARVLVLADGGFGFRISDAEELWPKPLRDPDFPPPSWIVLSMAAPVAEGDLWRAITDDRLREKALAVVSIDDLRREEVCISSGLSWERTAQDLVCESMYNAVARPLLQCRFSIILFGLAGALIVDATNEQRPEFTLVYDAENLEGV